jgi:hypothetical protein
MVRMHDYERRSCLLSIDVQFPKLEGVGSNPISRFVFNILSKEPGRRTVVNGVNGVTTVFQSIINKDASDVNASPERWHSWFP